MSPFVPFGVLAQGRGGREFCRLFIIKPSRNPPSSSQLPRTPGHPRGFPSSSTPSRPPASPQSRSQVSSCAAGDGRGEREPRGPKVPARRGRPRRHPHPPRWLPTFASSLVLGQSTPKEVGPLVVAEFLPPRTRRVGRSGIPHQEFDKESLFFGTNLRLRLFEARWLPPAKESASPLVLGDLTPEGVPPPCGRQMVPPCEFDREFDK